MDFDFDTGAIYGGLATLDVTTLPPLGSGPANVLTILANGALTLPKGAPALRPGSNGGTDIAGMFRYNTTVNQLEYFDSTTWQQLSFAGGAVSTFQTSLSGLTPSTATTGAVTLAGTLGATSGGTGTSTAPTAGQFLYSAAGTTYSATTLSGIAVTTFSGDTTGLTPATPTSGAITLGGTLALANGGTNFSNTGSNGSIVYNNGTALVNSTVGTLGQVLTSSGAGAPTWTTASSTITTSQIVQGDGAGAFTANGATFVGSPTYSGVTLSGTVTNASDATTKAYVDSLTSGLSWKDAARVGTLVNIPGFSAGTITVPNANATYFPNAAAPIVIDGVTLAVGNRVLVKNQTTTAQNGIYVVTVAGVQGTTDAVLVRSSDMTLPADFDAAAVFIQEGTQDSTAWVETQTVTTVNTDPVIWVQFSGQGTYIAGAGLTLTGNSFAANVDGVTMHIDGGNDLAVLSSSTASQVLLSQGAGNTAAWGALPLGNTNAVSGTLLATNGGTGFAAYTIGDTLYADTATTLAKLAIGTTGYSLVSNGTIPTWSQISLTAGVTGILPLANGGTNSNLSGSAGSVIYNNGTSLVNTSVGTAGQVLSSNGAGAPTWITPAATGVTTFQTSLSGLTPSTATSGAVTLAGTLGATSGGTGLTALGAANTVLGVDAAGTAAEYKTLTAGTGMSIVHGAGVVTFNNTGVTSVALSDASTTPIYGVTGSPVTTTGTLTVTLNTQTANTVFAGPASGGAAQPTFRTLTAADLGTALQLYKENPVTPTAPIATGTNAVAIGSSSEASAEDGLAFGDGTDARIVGMKAFANGVFSATAGSAQHGIYMVRAETTNNTLTELFINGTSEQIVLPDNSLFTFDILVAARRTDATGGGAGYRFVGVVRKDATAGSVTFVGTPSKTVIGETNGAWDAAVSVDTGTGAFRVRVNGENAKTIRWVATVQTTEVTN